MQIDVEQEREGGEKPAFHNNSSSARGGKEKPSTKKVKNTLPMGGGSETPSWREGKKRDRIIIQEKVCLPSLRGGSYFPGVREEEEKGTASVLKFGRRKRGGGGPFSITIEVSILRRGRVGQDPFVIRRGKANIGAAPGALVISKRKRRGRIGVCV